MKVTITHPFCWPAVRRGTERFIAELAQHLVPYGHDVVTLSSTPNRAGWGRCPAAVGAISSIIPTRRGWGDGESSQPIRSSSSRSARCCGSPRTLFTASITPTLSVRFGLVL